MICCWKKIFILFCITGLIYIWIHRKDESLVENFFQTSSGNKFLISSDNKGNLTTSPDYQIDINGNLTTNKNINVNQMSVKSIRIGNWELRQEANGWLSIFAANGNKAITITTDGVNGGIAKGYLGSEWI